jgi:hypothetical protein
MTLDQYIAQLKAHDWFYEYSDDHRVWQAGRDVIEQLRQAQRTLDPQGIIWNEHAPKEHGISRN